MKRTLVALLLALMLIPTTADAAKRKAASRKSPAQTFVKRETGEARPAVTPQKRERKQADGPPANKPGKGKKPIHIGPPVERQLKKAEGKVFDLRLLPPAKPVQKERPERHGPVPEPILLDNPEGVPTTSATPLERIVAMAAAPAPIITFEGLDLENWGAGSPPDTNGDVGPVYYIQSVNSSVGIYRKSDGFRETAFTFDTLMSQGNFGNQCDNQNFGDPVVLYDTFEDRWILTDFAFTLDASQNVNPAEAFQCFAVSITGNPLTGGWNFYSTRLTDGLNDYPKFGIWSDGLYMSANMFGFGATDGFLEARVWSYNKAQMYAGSPTVQVVSFDVGGGDFTVVPSNARLQAGAPPAGRPNYFMSTGNYLNAVSVYKFHSDWNSISLSTFTGPDTPIASTSWPDATDPVAPQSGTAQTLDTLFLRAMVQNQYSNIGGTESLWISHTVRRADVNGFAAPRWYQVNVTGNVVAASIPQAATWDPDAANVMYRFMPSLAVDRAGNMAMGYSTSSSTTFPSIKYAGRLATDPVNTFSQTEQVLFAGTASQTSIDRWGDYSSMTLDPDGCTFWYTNEYANPLSQASNKRWKTKIGSFKYASCTPVGAGGTVSGTVTATTGGAPISGATVQFGARSTTTNGSGFYSFVNIPAGTYPSITASFPGYTSATSTTIVVTDGGTTTRNFSLATAATSACLTDTTQADFQLGVGTNVDVTGSPGNVTLASPDNIDRQTINYTSNGVGFSNTSFAGQTFTPAVTGKLKKIDVNIFCASCSGANPNLILEARTTSSGNIVMTAGGLLASTTIAGTSSGSGGFMTFTFASPPTLTSGTQYGFVVKVASARTGTQAVLVSDGSGLTNGRRQSCSSSSCSNTSPTDDIVFISYMNVGFASSGDLVSSLKDSNPLGGLTPIWSNLSWNTSVPANTTLRFQVAGSNSSTGPFTFIGPNGTAATFFTASPASLSQFYGFRYLKYKAYFATTNSAASPTINDVTACYADVDCSGPGPVITPGGSQACSNSTGNTASGPAGATAYSWSITNGTITAGGTTQNVTYTAGASGNVGLMLTITEGSGCVKSNTVNVPIVATPATPTASNGGPYCEGATIQLSTPTVAGATYAWTGPGGFTSSLQNPTRANATTAFGGTYSVTVTVTGCTSAAGSTNVVVNATPATPTASNGGPYCEGATIQLSTPTVAGATYAWTGPGGFTSSLQNPTRASATTAFAGTYSVTITVNGCVSAAGTTNVVVNATPATPTASNGGPYCEGATIQLSTPTVAGATYAWTGPGGFTSSLQNPTRASATTAFAGTYSVTVTVNGCVSAAGTTNVVVNATPATPAPTNGGPYCEGATIQLFTSTVAGATYAWTGPNGFTSSLQNPTRANATTSDAGSYSVTVTVNNCPSAAGSTNVVVNTIPATPTASNGGPYCEGATIQLSTPTVAGATYAWTGPSGFTSSLQNPTRASATTGHAGTYSVTITVSGCTSAAGTTNVVVNATPATPTASNGGPYCEGATIQLSTPTVAGATYAWTGPNGFTSSQQNPTRASATIADAGTYSVTITVSGCTSAAGTTNVVVNATPATPTASNGGPYCEGATIQLSTPTVAGATYAWTGPNGFTSSLQNPTRASATIADAGTYSVTITVSGCTSAAGTTNVVVNATPATPSANNDGPYCEGSTIHLSTATVAGATYAWTGPNGFTSSQQNPTRASATLADAGTYSVTITVNGCTSAAGTTDVVVNPTPATPTASNDGPYCEGATIQLSTPTVAGATYAWTGPGGFTSSLQNPTRASATTADAGTYSVTVTVNGCVSAAGTTNVVVNPTPATPTITPDGPTTFCAGGSVTLTSSNASGNQWYLDGNPLGGATSQQYVATASGAYTVVVTASGCSSAASAATTVTVNAAPPVPTISPAGSIVFCFRDPVTLTSSSATGNQWYVGDTLLTGETGQTLLVTRDLIAAHSENFAAYFSVTVTANGCSSSSAPKLVEVLTPATPVISAAGPTTFCTGGSVELSADIEGNSGQWYLNGNIINGATTSSYVATAGGSYTYVNLFYASCPSDPSNAIVVTVNAIPATPTITPGGPTTFCAGGSVTLTSSSASGNQWYLDGNPIGGATNQAYIASATGAYTVIVTTSGCSSAASSATNVTVNPIPATPTITPDGPTAFCTGGSVTLTSSSASGNQWYLDGNPIGGATNAQYVATASGAYTVVVTTSGCSSNASAATNVTVNPIPATPTITPGGPTTFCAGGSVTLTSSSASGNQWYLNGNPIGGATNAQYIAAASGSYTVVVTTGGCSSAPSSATNVTVTPLPPTPTITPGGATTFCAGGSVTLTSSSASGNQWYLNGNPIGGATDQAYVASATGNYTVVVTSGCSSAPSAPTSVTVNPIPATPTIGANGSTTFCEGGTVTLTSSSATGNQWYRNGVLLGSETGQSTIVTVAGSYTVVVTASGCTSPTSAPTTVTVNPKPNVTISVVSPMFVGAGSTASVNHECAGATFAWSITGGTITSGNGTRSITFTADSAGTLTLFVIVTNSYGCTDSKSTNVTVTQAPFGAPPYFRANATGTTTASMLWASVASADHYEIYRSTDNVNWALRGSSPTTTFSESGLTASTTYLYKVRAIKADLTTSAYSTIDPATTVVLTDPSLTGCATLVNAIHITQLRTAINIARASVGLSAFTFTDPSLPAGSVIKAVHVTELRTAVAGVVSAIGVTPSYTDPTIVAGSTIVKATHVQEIRDLIR